MSKILWKSLLAGPVALGTVFAVSASATEALVGAEIVEDLQAVEETVEVPVELAELDTSVLEEIDEYSSDSDAGLSQVTSISQFSDVQPTDWAYTALQSLVERYGCVAGYPDGSFRGNRAMTRYEAAALLNACLDRVLEVIGDGETPGELPALLDEFQAELATLRGRVDSLEARTAELEANQFSTTTKLRGQIITVLGGEIDGPAATDGQDQIGLGYRVRLNFDTSFTGKDRLRTRFQARETFAPGALGLEGGYAFGGSNGNDDFRLDDLYYEFPVSDWISAKVGFNSQSGDDWVASTISPVDSASSGTLSDFGGPAQYDFDQGDLGFGLIFQLTDNLSFDVGYSGEDQTVNDDAALFNGDYDLNAQLTWLSDFIDVGLYGANVYAGGGLGQTAANGIGANPTEAFVMGGQVNVKFDAFEVGGGVAYATADQQGGAAEEEFWSWQATLLLPDFGGEGNNLGFLAGMPLRSSDEADDAFLVEGFYKIQIIDGISLTPSIIWIEDPGADVNDSALIGAIRTTFSF